MQFAGVEKYQCLNTMFEGTTTLCDVFSYSVGLLGLTR